MEKKSIAENIVALSCVGLFMLLIVGGYVLVGGVIFHFVKKFW